MKRAERRTMPRRIATLTLASATLTLAFATGAARAQSPADQWAAAIREQREAIATNRAARSRCAASDPRCGALADRGRLMEENLARLERQHTRMTGGSASRARTSEASRSAARRPAPAHEGTPPGVGDRPIEAPHPQRSLFSMLFGGGGATEARQSTVRIDGEPVEGEIRAGVDDGPASGDPSGGDWGAHSGKYRTLCVRTCDGYFFPVSFDASRSRLTTDANVCRALCPEAETRLYYHDASGQEAENAVAADDGSPLSEMPNAFLYRTKRIDGCTCGRPDPHGLPVRAGGLSGGAAFMASTSDEVPLPRLRPSPDEDPATQAVELSGIATDPVAPQTPLPAESAARLAATSGVGAEAAPERPSRVRIVGPKWLSDRAEEAAGASPVRDPAR